MKKKSILIAHPWLGHGGSEATTMWAIKALQEEFSVTLVTASEVDFERLNKSHHCSVNPELIEVIRAPRIPKINSGTRLVAWQHAYFHRFCRGIAHRFDLCVSGYNFVPFGKPSIQLIGDLSFSEELRKLYYVHGCQRLAHRPSPIRSFYIGAAQYISGTSETSDGNDLVLANSQWTAEQFKLHLDMDCEVVYPPVPIPENLDIAGEKKRDHSFLYIGRISPEKEIEKIIKILDRVRDLGYPVTLDVVGNNRSSSYELMVTSLIEARHWVTDRGYLVGAEKEVALRSSAFGIHAAQCEAFGIAAAEMASRGCLPFVAAGCGPAEVVPYEELQFVSVDDAVRKIVRLLNSTEETDHLRKNVISNASKFKAQEFVVNFRKFVDSMISKEKSSQPLCNASTKKDCPAFI